MKKLNPIYWYYKLTDLYASRALKKELMELTGRWPKTQEDVPWPPNVKKVEFLGVLDIKPTDKNPFGTKNVMKVSLTDRARPVFMLFKPVEDVSLRFLTNPPPGFTKAWQEASNFFAQTHIKPIIENFKDPPSPF